MSNKKRGESADKKRFWLQLSRDSLGGPNFSVNLLHASSHRQRLRDAREGMSQRLMGVDCADRANSLGLGRMLWESLHDLLGGQLTYQESVVAIKVALKAKGCDSDVKHILRHYHAERLFGKMYVAADEATKSALHALLTQDPVTHALAYKPEHQAEAVKLADDMESGRISPKDIRAAARKITRK